MEIDLLVVTPQGPRLNVKASRVTIPTFEGELQAGANHTPVVTALQAGWLAVVSSSKATQRYYIDKGYASLGASKIVVTTEVFEEQKDLDTKRARESQKRALQRLGDRSGSVDVVRALESLERAKARLRLKQLL